MYPPPPPGVVSRFKNSSIQSNHNPMQSNYAMQPIRVAWEDKREGIGSFKNTSLKNKMVFGRGWVERSTQTQVFPAFFGVPWLSN